MHAASSRLMVDRSVVRVDGRPFFTFGPRLLLTPPHRYAEVCKTIAEVGFTTIGSPPASPGTLPALHLLFDAAEEVGLFVILMADPRLPRHGRYLAEHFRHRVNLHSYCLPWDDSREDMEAVYFRERDEIRSADLFHPVWAPLGKQRPGPHWLRSMDLYAGPQAPWAASADAAPSLGERLAEVSRICRPPTVARPLFCSSLPVAVSDDDRRAGLYEFDPAVRAAPREALSLFPAYTIYDEEPRADWLAPEPALLRLRAFDMFSHGLRGMMLDFYEAMLGPPPHDGQDRFAEAVILAQEIAVLRDFFAEGNPEMCLIEPGHPKLRAAVLRHGEDHLILVRAIGEEDGVAGECYFQRTEVDVRPESSKAWNCWRVDFPSAHPVHIVQDAHKALRLRCGTVDMTAVLLLTPGRQRAEELAAAIDARLPLVARYAVWGLRSQLAKVELIEGQLAEANCGVRQSETLLRAREALAAAAGALAKNEYGTAYERSRGGQRDLRQLMRVQVARARVEPLYADSEKRVQQRRSYFLLPAFYSERKRTPETAYLEFT